MQIHDYRTAHRLSRKEFGALVEVSAETVRLWEAGERKPSHDKARLIEERTGGAIGKHETRPDIWPEGEAA